MSTALTKQQEMKGLIESTLTPEIKKCLPPQIKPEKFMRVLQTAVMGNDRLLQSNKTSLFAACVKCAQTGLLPDGKEAALVSFKDQVQFMPMLSGILKLVRNSGELSSITAECVYKNDQFRVWTDEKGQHLNHEPNYFDDRGDFALVYAVAQTKDGATYLEVMDKKQIEKIRNSSRSKNAGPWVDWFDEMARKSAIRRLSKRLPMSTDLEMAITADDEMYDMDEPQKEESPEPVKTKPAKLEALIAKPEPKPEPKVKESDLPL